MARKAESPTNDIGQVRIPAKLLASLDSAFSALRHRVVESAARQALHQKNDDEPAIVKPENMLQAARAVLATAPAQVEQALKRRETRYARRAS